MKRKSYYMLISSRMMVSRTTSIRMCVLLNLIIFISVCVNNVCALNSNEKYLINNTTPMVPLAKNNSNYPNISSISSNSLKNLNNIKSIPINTDNSTLSTGNELWDGIIRDCYRKPTFSCFQKNMFTYLDNKLDTSDVNVTNRLLFRRNKVDYEKYSREANDLYHDEKENEIPHDEPRSESPIEEVTDALYGKGVKFMMTHDIELKMPEIMFDGALFRISPQKIEGNGAIVKLELIPKQEIENRSTGRIFKKHIYKFFKNKLLLSFFALILIVKLIKIKLFWLLPIIIGVGKAKALLLKILLFFFPALAHIFKLCSYYHNNFHQTKYHHHHHSINHHHTGVPPWFHDHEPHSSVVIPNGPELIFTNPPKGNPAEFLHNGPKPHAHHPNDWEFSGPGLGPEYISDIHRNGVDGSVIGHGGGGGGGGGGGAAGVGVSGVGFGNFKPKLDDVNDIHAWGLGTTHPPGNSHSYNSNPFYPDPSRNVAQQKYKQQQMQFQQQQHQQHQQQQHHQQQQPQQQLGPVYVHNLQQKPPQAAAQIAAQYDPMINQQIANNVHLAQAQVKEAIRIQNEQRIIAQQQKILQQQPFVQDVQKIRSKDYDPFYTPIMSKIDKILLQLGLADDACKERMVCSMYKNPARYSPHSNFISAELSRDTSELQKPTTGSPLVTRFHRMVQAARDGQEQRDCMHIYSQCAITTE